MTRAMSSLLAIVSCASCGIVELAPDAAETPDATIVDSEMIDALVCSAPTVECEGACIDPSTFSTDAENCGRCGHSCLGGTCEAGLCQPVTLANGQLNPLGLGVSATDVYWTNGGDPANAGQGGAVMRVAKAGGSPTTLVPLQANAGGVRVDATHVYWTTPTGIHRVPIGGGPPTMLAAASTPGPIELHDTSVYWYESSAVRKVARAGGIPVTLVSGATSGQCDIVVDDNRVYWAASSTIRAVPPAGGTTTNVISSQINSCGLALTASALVWTNLANGGSVMKAALDGSGPTMIATGRMGPQSVIVDGTDVYWTENGVVGGAPSALVRAPLSGGTPQVLASWPRATVGIASQLAQDADALYWIIAPPPGSPSLGYVMKVAKP